jgi:hypothetical protein
LIRTIHHVRPFLRACAEGRTTLPGPIPEALRTRAAKALRRRPATALVTADDLVGELLRVLWEGRWSGLDWDALTDAALESRLMTLLRELAVESADGWSYRKALREHVAGAMVAGLPAAGRDMPATLCEGGRLSRARVAEAAAWIVSETPELAGDANRVTQALLGVLSVRFVPIEPANDDREALDPADPRDAYVQLEAALDVAGLVRRLCDLITPRELVVLRGRLAGRRLQTLADELGCAVSTAFKLEERASRKAAEVVRSLDVGPDTLLLALDLCLEPVAT